MRNAIINYSYKIAMSITTGAGFRGTVNMSTDKAVQAA